MPRHLPEYLIEAALLGLFMVSACVVTITMWHPSSPTSRWPLSPIARRAICGLLMGVTAIALILSPWGGRSGAHMNPAVTLTYLSLGKIQPIDALAYVMFQCAGGIVGVTLVRAAAPRAVAHANVRFAATIPGASGPGAAFAAELVISALMMGTVLVFSSQEQLRSCTPFIVAALIALFITFEAPLSGMSMNPARTLASAVHSRDFRGWWVYIAAPLAGMLLAAGAYTSIAGTGSVRCAKLHHPDAPCLFKCNARRE